MNSAQSPIRAAVIGIGGFGALHAANLLELQHAGEARLVATADPQLDTTAELRARVAAAGGRHYTDYREMLAAEHGRLDLVVVATPHHWHYTMADEAMTAGCHVLVEKPPTVTIQDLDRLIARRSNCGVLCAVGFHQVPTPALQRLKQLTVDGTLGAVQRVIAHTIWVRPYTYYRRAAWAGRLRLDDQWVLDGPTMNPLAHTINNALYLAAADRHGYAAPRRVRGELYRAHRIESEDTSCAVIETESGVPVYYFGTLCGLRNSPQTITVVGDRATAELRINESLVLHRPDGSREEHDVRPQDGPGRLQLLRLMFEGMQRGELPAEVVSLERARPFLLAANGIFESSAGIAAILPPYGCDCEWEGTPTATIADIEETMARAVAEARLFSELGVPWGRATQTVDLRGYDHFTGAAYGGKRAVC